MKDSPSYYATIPANVRYCEKITANAKLLYGEISALTNKEGYCWATNNHFAKLYKVDKVSISRWISALEENNFIKCKETNRGHRKIYIMVLTEMLRGINRNVKGPKQNCYGVLSNTLNIKKNTNGQTRFDHTWAVKLTNLVENRRVQKGRIKLHQWEAQFRKLRQIDGMKKSRIRKVIGWYLKNSHWEYVTLIYHSDELRKKFERIEAAMIRKEGGNGELEDCRLTKTIRKGKTTTKGIIYTDVD